MPEEDEWYPPEPEGINLLFEQTKQAIEKALDKVYEAHRQASELEVSHKQDRESFSSEKEMMVNQLANLEKEKNILLQREDALIDENRKLREENSIIKKDLNEIQGILLKRLRRE